MANLSAGIIRKNIVNKKVIPRHIKHLFEGKRAKYSSYYVFLIEMSNRLMKDDDDDDDGGIYIDCTEEKLLYFEQEDGEDSSYPSTTTSKSSAVDESRCILSVSLSGLYQKCSERASTTTILHPLIKSSFRGLINLVKFPNAARALVYHPMWLPRSVINGIELEKSSLLGPLFHFSAIPDDRFETQLDLCKLLPSDVINGKSDAGEFVEKVVGNANVLHCGLEEMLLSLLKNSDTYDYVFKYLAEVIKLNSSMANIQIDPNCASSGMLVNLSAVMLRLCKTLNEGFTNRGEIDVKYVFYNTRLDLSKLTSLNASSEEVAVWIDKDKHGNTNSSNMMSSESDEATSFGSNRSLASNAETMTYTSAETKYTFVCEIFFMTARVLHLGLVKAISDLHHLHTEKERYKNTLSLLKAMQEKCPCQQLEQDIEDAETKFESYWRKYTCYACHVVKDTEFLQQALSFYRLMVVWLVDLVGGFKMPLPSTCPMVFACIPEHFVEDVMELLSLFLRYQRTLGHLLPVMDEFMNFIIMFMASPNYIRNSNLREKMVGVLCWCVRNRRCSASTMTIFEDNQLCLQYLVRNLLKLYVGNEFTGPKQFVFRKNIIVVLEYLWKIPSHCNAWRQMAEEDVGFYLVFLNFVINGIMSQFSKSLHRILALEEMESEMSNAVEWEHRSFQERRKRALHMHSKEDKIRNDVSYVVANMGMLAFTSEQIVVPFLLPQMVDIVATMLNYILLHLVGLHGKSFCLKQPRTHGYGLDILLSKTVSIYIHLARGDTENIFVDAIAKDSRLYKHQLFTDAATVVLHEDSSLIQEFVEFGNKAVSAASKAMDTEAVLGEIPIDFLDPIEFTIMADPVTLPSAKTVDRAVILRHLLNYKTDPFSGLPLTQDMIIPNAELKAKIDKFIRFKLEVTEHGET